MELDEHCLAFLEETSFYKTQPSECPYLENKQETKILTWLSGNNVEKLHSTLVEMGFRRSQTAIYKPHCANCSACVPLRLDVRQVNLNKTQRKIWRLNDHIHRKISSPILSDSHFELYQKYMDFRHKGESMSQMSYRDVAMMVEETTVDTSLTEYYEETPMGDKLVGWCITDCLDHGLSMVYSIFDPDNHSLSPGIFAILDHIELAKEMSFPYLYLGYWIEGSQKMAYKNQFYPHEIYQKGQWITVKKR